MVETRNPAEVPGADEVAGKSARGWRRRFSGAVLAGMLAVGAMVGTAAPASADTSSARADVGAMSTTIMDCAYLKPTMRVGDRGICVEAVQVFLRKLTWITGKDAFHPGPRDGIYGSRTARAVEVFQRHNRISPYDGIVGPRTWEGIAETCRAFYRAGADICRDPI